ncbi:hypothetical protein SNE40_017466 [Patella caerulea]|uniref:Lipase maturation factor n=1 Tax=Patella caerulea TaxID=87958 RepID=A0AAN8PFW1_PATCE
MSGKKATRKHPPDGGVRKRKLTIRGKSETSEKHGGGGDASAMNMMRKESIGDDKERSLDKQLAPGSYWLTRIVMLRYLGFIYFVAFLVALHQNKPLLGLKGLLPVDKVLDNIKERTNGDPWIMVNHVPSVLWWFDYRNNLDVLLDGLAYSGIILSVFLMVRGAANWFIMAALWILYQSIVNVGQRWYSFGWESQLLETGFLAIFLCPVWNLSSVPQQTPTSRVVIYGYRWLIFRIMLGAGLIKIRGDQCWRDLTCMNYHYETQPVPNPMSYYMHQSPEFFHKFETLSNHFIELIVPFALFLTRRIVMIGGSLQILFQVVLIISGNLSFLNWLTILPSLACFDDLSLSWMFSNSKNSVKHQVVNIEMTRRVKKPQPNIGNYMRNVFNISLGIFLVYLSIPVVQNLFSSRQAMNSSFDPLRLVNTYGAFGSVTKKRTEVIFQGTMSKDPMSPSAVWEEYEFKCKPGNVTRTPCIISPYHYRLDWLLWFVPFHKSFQYNPWIVHLVVKLLANDEDTLSLIRYNPFINQPPRYIRIENYRYVFTKIGSPEAKSGAWWKRKHIGNYLQPLSFDSVRDFMKNMQWEMPKVRKSKKTGKS